MTEGEIIQTPTGYYGTPLLPGSRWRVHDATRPQPRVVVPGQGADQPPSDADVLFDGTSLGRWRGHDGKTLQWKIVDGTLVVPGTKEQHIVTQDEFGDCQLHVEWSVPANNAGEGQATGNSGIFLMGRYEIQVLNSYQNPTYADGHAGAIYGQHPPLVNAARKPGEWQTFDIFFVVPCFEDGELRSPAYVTVVYNGVLVQLHRAILGPTRHLRLPAYDQAHGLKGPLMLQDHRDPVRFRNIWIRPVEGHNWAAAG